MFLNSEPESKFEYSSLVALRVTVLLNQCIIKNNPFVLEETVQENVRMKRSQALKILTLLWLDLVDPSTTEETLEKKQVSQSFFLGLHREAISKNIKDDISF